LCSPHLRG